MTNSKLLTGISICIYEEMLKDNTNFKIGINEIYLELELQYDNFKTKILENNPNEEIDEYSMQQLFISHQEYKGMPLEFYAIKELFNNMELATDIYNMIKQRRKIKLKIIIGD